MGAAGSTAANEGGANVGDLFVLVATAPPGVGKESLMGTFIAKNQGKIAYCAMAGAVKTEEEGLLYSFNSVDDPDAPVTYEGSYSTALAAMQAALQDGKSVVVDLDVAGVRSLRDAGVPAAYVFILPHSMERLEQNLAAAYAGRPNAQQDADSMLAYAEQEIVALDEDGLYDYGVQNDEDDAAAIDKLGECLRGAYVAQKVLAMGAPVPRQPMSATSASAVQGQVGSSHAPRALPSRSANVSWRSDDTGAVSQALDSLPQDGTPRHATSQPLSQPTDSLPLSGHDADLAHVPTGMERWRGKVAVVTGATSGIGWAICRSLALAGMRVVAAGRRKERLEALQREVLAAGVAGRHFLPIMCDITKEAEVKTLIALVGRTFGGRPVSVLVNNAGCGRRPAGLMDGSTAAWVEMVSTNVLAVAICCREAVATMRESGDWGHIINVSSLAGHRLPAGLGGADAFYAGTKSALRVMTEGLRQEARAARVPLRVSLVSPGIVHTEFFASMTQHDPEAIARVNSLPGLEAHDIADTVLYMLAAPEHVEVNDVLMRATDQAQ